MIRLRNNDYLFSKRIIVDLYEKTNVNTLRLPLSLDISSAYYLRCAVNSTKEATQMWKSQTSKQPPIDSNRPTILCNR